MPRVKKPTPVLQPHFLREWRKDRKFTQEKAAEHFGISRPQLSKIENSKSPYNQALMEAAAKLYRCTVADLTERHPLDRSAPWSLIDSLRKATPEQRKTAIKLVETILEPST